ncbi:MAG: hypothetical protein RLZZ437_1558, partial [Pseudomonadota bacterium]
MVPRIVLALTACAMLAACGNDDNPILMN